MVHGYVVPRLWSFTREEGSFSLSDPTFAAPYASKLRAPERSVWVGTVVTSFMRIPFDQHTISGLPCTRMLGSSKVALSPIRIRRPVWATAVVFALAVGAIPSFAGGISLAQKHEIRHEIDQLEDEWRDAVLTGDAKKMASLLADDYMAITPNGTLQSRDETLQILRSGRLRFSSISLTDRKVRFYGATAVVTSLATIQASTPDGPMTGNFRYTRVYVRDAHGLWRIVSFEASRVRPPGGRRRGDSH